MRRHGKKFALLLLLLLAACGDMAKDGIRPDGGTSGDSSASDAGAPALTLSVEGSAVPMVGEQITIHAVMSYTNSPVESYTWTLDGPSGADVTFQKSATGDSITFTPGQAGTYTIQCEVLLLGGETFQASAYIQVESGGKKLTYTARVIPSPTSKLPPHDEVIQVGETSLTHNITVKDGKEVLVTVEDTGGTKLPSVVRLLQVGADPLPREFYLPTGSGTVRVSDSFHALFLPEGLKVPAELRPNESAASLSSSWVVSLAPGAEVKGAVKRSDDSALAGAKVTVHTVSKEGVLVPSSVGTTDAKGAFTVHARPGSVSLTIVPPEDDGLPVAVVDAKDLALSGDASGWAFKYAAAQPVQVSGKVATSDGKTPAKGAKVVMTATLSAPAVGVLTTSKTHAASGLYSRVLSSGDKGQLLDKSGAEQFTVPAASHQVAVWPGPGEGTKEGYFQSTWDLKGPSASLSLALAARVTLSGSVVDQSDDPVQARVVVSAQTGSFSTTSDAEQGKFSLALNNKASYSLVVRSTNKKVSTYIEPKLEIDGSKTLATIKLPPALVISGKVTTSGNLAVAGSLIRIWCSGADCPSHEIVDETTALADGFYELRVPPTPQP